MVATAEDAGDPGVAEVGQLAEHVHADLARGDERPAARLAAEVFDRPSEHLRRFLEDQLRRDDAWTRRRQQVRENFARDLFGQGNTMQTRVGRDANE